MKFNCKYKNVLPTIFILCLTLNCNCSKYNVPSVHVYVCKVNQCNTITQLTTLRIILYMPCLAINPLRTTACTFWHFWYSFSMVQIIHFKQTATRAHRWLTFMRTISSFRRPARVCPWPFSVLFIHNVNQSND